MPSLFRSAGLVLDPCLRARSLPADPQERTRPRRRRGRRVAVAVHIPRCGTGTDADLPPRVVPVLCYSLDLFTSSLRRAERSGARLKGLDRRRCRGSVAQRAVWPDSVVLVPPAFDEHLRLRQRVEDLPIQQLVAKLPIEALHVTVLPRAARFDEHCAHADALEPVSDSLGGELRTIIASDVFRHAASSLTTFGSYRCVARGWFSTRHARRSDTCGNLARTRWIVWRRRAGLRSFPRPLP